MPDSSRNISVTDLTRAIADAHRFVHTLVGPTPITEIETSGGRVLAKREDLSPIHSFKWRGAFNRMHHLQRAGAERVVAASAGNHAQGVAVAARYLGMHATVYMPHSTPLIKRAHVERVGGAHITIVLAGDRFRDAADGAASFAAVEGVPIVEAFDHPQVIAGQGTVGIEMAEHAAQFDTVYVPIGGGGLAAGVACALRHADSSIRVIGVEVEGQDSMSRSLRANRRVHLEEVSGFCDGTAVHAPGVCPLDLCRTLLDTTMTVTEDEVCAAIQVYWETARITPEPSGAVGLAGVLRGFEDRPRQRPATIITGANMDFTTLGRISRRSGIGRHDRSYFCFHIDERSGALVGVLDALHDCANIIDFQYGKIDAIRAWPIIGFEFPEPVDGGRSLHDAVAALPIEATEVTGHETVDFRMIPFERALCREPLFVTVDFPDRPGALHELMREVSDIASI